MSIKKLLGLEDFPIKEYELIDRISKARKTNTDVVDFTLPSGKSIRFKISSMYPEGIMQGNYRQFKNVLL